MIHGSIILNTDSYKASHWNLYPPGTEQVYCYIESRGGRWPKTLFFGLQMFLLDITLGIYHSDIDEAESIITEHGEPFNRKGWEYICNKHDGYLPVSIRAVPEGTVLPTRNVLVTIENTDPNCYWLPSYLETALLRDVWYPTTVATNSYYCKQVIREFLNKTCDDPLSQLDFKLHDFGGRGVSSFESAQAGGLAHLINFKGTDNIPALAAADAYYGCRMAGFSIPASEHSTIIAWGRDGEADAYRNLLEQYGGPGKTVACVSDSYDLWHAIHDIWGDELKSLVETNGCTLVIRPDSGHPPSVVSDALSMIGQIFGYTGNSKGYRVLPPYVRLIQGDGVNETSIREVLDKITQHGWSAENVGFGMGGALLQQVDRDTLRFAMKASEVVVDGVARPVSKSPIDDPSKASKSGRLALVRDVQLDWATVSQNDTILDTRDDQLVEVFRDGEILKQWTFDEIRERAASQ